MELYMPRALEATCDAGIVTAEGTPVPGAIILSEGVSSSSGFAIFDLDKVYYVSKTSPDLKTTLEKMVDALTDIAAALQSLDTAGFLIGATAGVPGPPMLVSTILSINSTKAELDTLRTMLL